MSGRDATDWSRAPSLLIAHAGGLEGRAALGPALAALAAWAGRRGARLTGLGGSPPPWEGAPPREGAPLWEGAPLREGARPPHAEGDPILGPDLAVTLDGEPPWGAVVLSDPGHTALEIAYALYLAGVPRRAGFAPEFGGGVLSHPVPPPPPSTRPEARHLRLLDALGLTQGE